MTTSGTIGATQIDVTTIIEHAARRCGVLASTLSAEQQISAKENLYFLLSDLANRGVSLWCVQKNVLGLALNKKVYDLPVGTLEILNTLYRTRNFVGVPASSSAITWATDAGTGNAPAVTTISVTSATVQTLNLSVQISPDNATWTTLYTVPAFTTVAGLPYWFDIDPSSASRYWSIRENTLPALTLTSASFGYNTTEIEMSPLNRDDYTNLPNKDFAGRALQYWYDKQYQVPRLWLWPVPDNITAQIVIWNHRHIQDIGALSNTLEVPQRWFESIIFSLAARMVLELPADKLPPGRLEWLDHKADEHLRRAEDGETDGAPIRITPNFSAYTR